MNIRDAAEAVLREAGEPLHSNDIADRMVESDRWRTKGKTPYNSVRGELATAIRKRGDNSRFRRVRLGVYTLAALMPAVASATEVPTVDEGPEAPREAYGVANIMDDACFLERPEIESLLERLRSKKNLILQGPPGTGKTWLARRLAYALVGRRDPSRVRAIQFHPNLSYEDFVRGYRPSREGRLSLVDGVFMQVARAAHRDPKSDFVLVVEEINRGNPAQIFGELLTLLEADKRSLDEALELSYPDPEDGADRPFHVPPNLYMVGTMNLADRSLALVDLALRRRFAFADLEPQLGDRWLEWIVERRGVDHELARDIRRRIEELNVAIATEESLGRQFRLGHSYVCPTERLAGGTRGTRKWFERVARTEIRPQLDEYWFDSPKTAEELLKALLKGW